MYEVIVKVIVDGDLDEAWNVAGAMEEAAGKLDAALDETTVGKS